MKNKISIERILIGFIIFGIGISIINFTHYRSLWVDEAMLALNIVNRPAIELLHPLHYDQVAPIGFLLLEKFFLTLLGNNDWTMRIVPMLSFFMAIFLLNKVGVEILNNKRYSLFSTAFFATTVIIISYSTEVKQYMMDVMIVLLLLLFTIRFNTNQNKKIQWIYTLIGVVSIWFSNVAVIILFTSSIYTIHKNRYCLEKKYPSLTLMISSWLTSFLIYFILFIENHPTQTKMINYWIEAGAFLPQNTFDLEFYLSLWNKISLLFETLGTSVQSYILMFLFISGLHYLMKGKRGLIFLLCFPIIIHLTLSYFQIYPFGARLILYLLPLLLLIISNGLLYLETHIWHRQFKVYFILPILLVINLYPLTADVFPEEKEEIKKSMMYLNLNLKKNEQVYTYYGAIPAFLFYKNSFDAISEINDKDIFFASEHRKNWSKYNEPISEMKDSVWILFSHLYWVPNDEKLNEHEFIVELFIKNGYQIVDEKHYVGSSVYHAVRAIPTVNQ